MTRSAPTLLFCILLSCVFADDNCQFIAGNTYCKETQHVTYSNFERDGTFKSPTSMDDATGNVIWEDIKFTGSPFSNEEKLSMHFRGPCTIESINVYSLRDCYQTTAITSTAKASATSVEGFDSRRRRHSHHRPRQVSVTSSASSSTSFPSASPSCNENTWYRSSFYDASSQVAENVVFLNNLGGVNGSGTWSTAFGNSLSFASADGHGAAASPQILEKTLIPSNVEVIVKTAKQCDSSCPFVRGGESVAYHGFKADESIFIVRLTMPHDQTATPINSDMPAWWMLNSRVSDCGQYTKASCWPACGEIDLLEVLDSGNERCTSHVHIPKNNATPGEDPRGGGGTPDWIKRPLDKATSYLVYFDTETHKIEILVLDDSFVIGNTITKDQLSAALASKPASQFSLP